MRFRQFLEGDVIKGDFGKKSSKGKPEKMSLLQAFGSHEINILDNIGIKFVEKPTYWQDLDSERVTSRDQLKAAIRELHKFGYNLKTYSTKELWGSDPRGPLVSPSHIPSESCFLVMFENGKEYLVDRTGAQSYFRMWSRVK